MKGVEIRLYIWCVHASSFGFLSVAEVRIESPNISVYERATHEEKYDIAGYATYSR